jgi:hypothetical protein
MSFSSSARTPAPIAVQYYGKGGAAGFHLSLMQNRGRMIQENAKACQRFRLDISPAHPPLAPLGRSKPLGAAPA